MSDSTSRHRRISELFAELADLGAEEQRARLTTLGKSDASMAEELASMLRADRSGDGGVEALHQVIHAVAESGDLSDDPLIGTSVGGYTIDRLIAAGGMGRVYEATQQDPVRPVAIKLLDPQRMSRATSARFRHESLLMARLVHPGIAQIYEAGIQSSVLGGPQRNTPWYAMELVPNAVAITEVARDRRMGLLERIALFLRVCDAVHHGHGRGVIHRDIKPSNVLVDALAPTPTPKVIDFGIARSIDSDIALATQRTEIGQLVGTLQYMSPEQLAGDPSAIDVRTDVYALGLLLYELVTDQPAFDIHGMSVPEAMQHLSGATPKRLRDVPRFDRSPLVGDLETIVRKAIDRDQGRRYRSVDELSQDLRRLIAHEPIAARPPSALHVVRLFARRHRALMWGAVATIVMLVLGVIGTSIGLARAIASERVADVARSDAEFESYVANVTAAEAALRNGESRLARERLEAAPAAHRGWEWRHLWARHDRSQARVETGLAYARSMAFSSDGRLLAVGDGSGQVRVLDVATLAVRWSGNGGRGVRSLSFSPDGSLLAVAFDQIEVLIVETTGWTAVAVLTAAGPREVAFDGEGTTAHILNRDGSIERWPSPSEPTATVTPPLPDGIGIASTLSADRTRVAFSSATSTKVVSLVSGTVIASVDASENESPTSTAARMSFSNDSGELAVVVFGRRLVVHNLATGAVRGTALDGHLTDVVAWAPDDRELFFGDGSGTITVRDVHTFEVRRRLIGHEVPIGGIAHSSHGPRGPIVASVDWAGVVRLWGPDTDDLRQPRTNHAWVYSVAFAPDGRWFVTSAGEVPPGDPMVASFDTASSRRRWASPPADPPGIVFACDVSSDGSRIIHDGALPHTAVLRDAESGVQLEAFSHPVVDSFRGCAFRPGGLDFFTTVQGARLLWSGATGQVVRRFEQAGTNERTMSPDGTRLLLSPHGRTGFEVFDIDSGARVALVDSPDMIWSVDWSDDGRWVAARLREGDLCLWSTADWSLVRTWKGDGYGGQSVRFEPGGRLVGPVVSGLRVWDVERGREIVTLAVPGESCSPPAFAADGSWLGIGCTDGRVFLFDAPLQRK